MTIVAACIPVLHPLYDRARTGLRKIFPSLGPAYQGTTDRRHRRHRRPEGPDSPGFWSLKLRAIGLAESWWSSTAGRTSRRSGARGQTAAEEEEEGHPRRPGSGAAASEQGGAVVIHSEGGGGQSDLEQRSRDLTISVDALFEMSDMEPGRDIIVGQGLGQDGDGHTTVIGRK